MARLIGGPAHGLDIKTEADRVIIPLCGVSQYNRWGQRLFDWPHIVQVRYTEHEATSSLRAEYTRRNDGTYRAEMPLLLMRYIHRDCDACGTDTTPSSPATGEGACLPPRSRTD